MQEHTQKFDFSGLSVQERIDLALDLWDSLDKEREAMPLTKAQEEELERRAKAMDAGQMAFSAWDQVKSRLLAKLRQ